MIFSFLQEPLMALIYILSLLYAITVHEFAHAWVSDKLGDPTARLLGRVTLNPLAHLDPLGTVALLLIGFGWGKPVPFDPFNLENPKRDSALIALAGPASNFISIIFAVIAFKLTGIVLIVPFVQLNLMLGLFNLIPIHPLDGFKIVGGLLSEHQAQEWYQLERYGMYFLLFMLLPLIQVNQERVSIVHYVLSPVLDNVLRLLLG